MKLNTVLILILLLTFSCSFAQNITPDQIERSQEMLKEEEALRKRIEQPQKIFIKEIVLPQRCLITTEELKQVNLRFAGKWLSSMEIQELLDILTQAYQKAYPNNKSPQITYDIDKGRLMVKFGEQ